MRSHWPGTRVWGLGGPDLEKAGAQLIAGLDQLAVMGFAEVLGRLRFFRDLEQQLRKRMAQGEADLVLAVDYPGLNLRLARYARSLGIPVVYYIAPQVWAWKAHRASQLARDADEVAVILPFEEEVLRRAGASVRFVGHPLMDRAPLAKGAGARLREELGVAADERLLAVLPGSRRQELERHLQVFVEAAHEVARRHGPLRPVLAAAPGVDVRRLAATGLLVTDDARALLHEARAALVKSGTSTLEAAVAGVPFVCAYRTSALTYALARRLVRVPHIALANLVAGEGVVPELLQHDATPARLAAALGELVADGGPRDRQLEGLERIRRRLGAPGAAARTAQLVIDVLQRRSAQAASPPHAEGGVEGYFDGAVDA